MLLLSLETSTTASSVALHRDGQLLVCLEMFVEKSHAAALTVLVAQALQLAQVAAPELAAVAVAAGPGSYTGLRIGLSTAKGLCFALERPLLTVNTLEVLAASQQAAARSAGAWLCPVLDARRHEVYTALYDADLGEQQPPQPLVLTPDTWPDVWQSVLAQRPLWWVGDGAAKCRQLLPPHPQAHFFPEVRPSARWVGDLGYQAFGRGAVADLAYAEPFYLKAFAGPPPRRA